MEERKKELEGLKNKGEGEKGRKREKRGGRQKGEEGGRGGRDGAEDSKGSPREGPTHPSSTLDTSLLAP